MYASFMHEYTLQSASSALHHTLRCFCLTVIREGYFKYSHANFRRLRHRAAKFTTLLFLKSDSVQHLKLHISKLMWKCETRRMGLVCLHCLLVLLRVCTEGGFFFFSFLIFTVCTMLPIS